MKKPGRENKIAVVVGSVTNDLRLNELPTLKVFKKNKQYGLFLMM